MTDCVKKALFVCLGNSCRSIIAEAVFLSMVSKNIWEVDSAALADWNVGLAPNPRAVAVLENHGLTTNHIARQVQDLDYHVFDYIFGMDSMNVNELHRRAPSNCKAEVLLLGSFDPQGDKNIRDPYFDVGSEGFELCYDICRRSCQAFLQTIV